jgi:hypothetical protein
MPIFRAPQYAKVANPKTGVQEPCYTFSVEYIPIDDGITFVADTISDISLQNLQKCILENVQWWNAFIQYFLEASSKFFTKQYTIEHINKLTKHTLSGTADFKQTANVCLLPNTIQILGGNFIVNWQYTLNPIIIDIPDLEDDKHNIELAELPVSDEHKNIDGLQELNIDELPVEINGTEDTIKLDSPLKFYEKQRVKEARLKAKLAVYKAQRQMAQYYEKYGNELSDSDYDSESSDEEGEDDFDQEEVQL